MRSIVFIFIFSVFSFFVAAQSNIRLNNYWENMYYINPAAINNEKSLVEFTTSARKQWVNFEGAPLTYFATATSYFENMNTQFGVKLLQDKIGYTATTDIDLSYTYALPVNTNWNLNMGLGVRFQNMTYDISDINFSTTDDPDIYKKLMNDKNYNADLGLELTDKKLHIGLAAQNLFSIFFPINEIHANTNFLYARYRSDNRDYLNYGYGACAIQYGKTFQMELNATVYFKPTTASNSFQLGVIYRTWSEIGLTCGFDVTRNLKLLYSYDYNVGGISRSSLGTHELMISFALDRAWRCKNCEY